MRKRPVADRTSVMEKNMSRVHFTRNQSRLTGQKSQRVPGKKRTTPRPKITMVLKAWPIWKRASRGPPYSSMGPSRISVSDSAMSKGATPMVPGRNIR